MASTYVFRDDLEADKQRAADAQVMTLGAPAPQPAAPAMPTAPQAAPQPAPMPAAPAGPSQAENPFQAFSKALEAQNPFKQQVKQGVQQTLANPGAAADAANTAARDRLARENNAAQEEARNQAITNYGGYQSGQAGQALDKFRNARLMNEQSFELDAAANKAGAAEQARSNAIGQGVALIGQEEQSQLTREQMDLARSEGALERASREGVAFAGLNLEEKRMAQEGMQFASKLDFDKSALAAQMDEATRARVWQAIENEKSRTSQEKVAFAGLDLERDKFQAADANAKQGLNLEANAQALTRLGMDREEAYRYASLSQAKSLAEKGLTLEESAQELTRMGMTQEDARYYAGLASQEKQSTADRQSRETLTYAQIGSQERLQASEQLHQSAQADLDRSLEQLLSNDRIQAQFQLSDLDRTFQERMQSAGFVQEKEMQTMRADLEQNLLSKGIEAEAAKQIADQKFTELMSGRDQAFEQQMTTLKQSWATGERVATQDWDSAMQAGERQHQEIMTRLESTLRLGEQQNAQAFQTSFQTMQNDFTRLVNEENYSREEATRMATQAFEESMQQAGFTQDQITQGSQLAWQSFENQMSRASQEMMASASLAQQDSQFMAELEQRYQFNSEDLEIRQQELGAQLELMGLQGDQLKAALTNDKIQNAMSIAALGMEIGDGSAGSMAPFVEALGTSLEAYFQTQGIDISKSDFVAGLTKSTTTTPTTGGTGTKDSVQAAQDQLADIFGELPQSVSRSAVNSQLSNIAVGTYKASDFASLKSQPGFSSNIQRGSIPGYETTGKTTTQQAKDFMGFYKLIQLGVPEKQAAALTITVIGDARFKDAYRTLNGKDWA